ncbi:MAG: pantoate--beta-alanine ligase [Thermoguttaceae bacterium]|nr:pantoate--beta-alanine ligase [Thermoguttaceae bacterium]MDW8039274.1 pantoate--beta-alanine ligase [Thermoguttaceae bacterium]
MKHQPEKPRVVTTVAEMRQLVQSARQEGRRIGFVPTMGALHEGHLSLVRAAKEASDFVVVSIYVNPTQFGPQEDFAQYPRTLEADLDLLAVYGIDVVFAPSDQEMYPAGFDSWVEVGGIAAPLEGRCRPGHFRGVATVVLKLFNIVQPDIAWFGQKDYQQALVIQRMVADLNVPVEIRVCPTVREPDGLAMSSRNRYLGPESRQKATILWRALCEAKQLVAAGQKDTAVLAAHLRSMIAAVPGAQIDYVAFVDPQTLSPVRQVDRPVLAALAVRIDGTRLIDNELIAP